MDEVFASMSLRRLTGPTGPFRFDLPRSDELGAGSPREAVLSIDSAELAGVVGGAGTVEGPACSPSFCAINLLAVGPLRAVRRIRPAVKSEFRTVLLTELMSFSEGRLLEPDECVRFEESEESFEVAARTRAGLEGCEDDAQSAGFDATLSAESVDDT